MDRGARSARVAIGKMEKVMNDTPQDAMPEELTEDNAQEIAGEAEPNLEAQIAVLRAELAEAKAECNRLSDENAALLKQWAAKDAEVERLRGLLAEVREDGTGSLDGKRVWPIRAALYRRIAAELDGREVDAKTGFPKPPDGEEATQDKED